jgi:hypothetical protein
MRQDTQHQQPQATQTDGKTCSNICHNRKFSTVQATSSSNNDILKVATLVQQIITEFSEAVSEKDQIIIITKMALNLMKQNDC